MNKSRVIPLSREYINQKALRIRQATKTEIDFLFPIEETIEVLLECMEGSLEIVEDDKLPYNIPAKTVSYPNINSNKYFPYTIIQIKESVYLGAISGNPEDRFTLAHEMGHAFLLHGCTENKVCGIDENILPTEDPEWQADTFAKELLAPSYFFTIFDPIFLAKVCKTPIKYVKEQSDYILAKEIIESGLKKSHIKKSDYIVNYQEIPYPFEQLLLIPLNSPFYKKLRIPQK
jgi:hypothetical protein